MGYVGVPPQSGFITTAKQRVTSSTNNYVDLDHSISSLADVIIWVNFVKQDSTNLSLTTSTRITLGGTLVASDIVEIAYLGKAVNTQTPSTGSVSVDMLSATGTKSSSTFLAGDNSFKTVSGTTINNNADNRVITGSGTANTLEGEANLTFDGSTMALNKSGSNGGGLVTSITAEVGNTESTGDGTSIAFDGELSNSTWRFGKVGGINSGSNYGGGLVFHTNAGNGSGASTTTTERMRIDNAGKMFIQCTQAPSSSVTGIQLADSNSASKFGGGSGTGVSNLIVFYNGNGEVGKIFTNGTGTTYNTSSDYRRKENVNYTWDATTRLKQLKPARFNFKADTDTTLDGFLAHEVSSIVPDAVTGVKDETENKKNVVLNPVGDIAEEGITEAEWTQGKADGKYLANSTWHEDTDVPVYQAIDQSKLVPLLVKTIQELETRIKTLEDA